jgi:hypothetical protein
VNLEIMGVILLCGAADGFINVFICNSGLHLPSVENDNLDNLGDNSGTDETFPVIYRSLQSS